MMFDVEISLGGRIMLANLDHLSPHNSSRSDSSWHWVRQLWLPVDADSPR